MVTTVWWVVALVGVTYCGNPPNIVFLICESTDGRTYRPESPVPIPHITSLLQQGVRFDSNYANAPVCCPSRASLWSGRYPHKITHQQKGNPGLTVNGAWNNYEGLPGNYSDKIGDVLGRNGYEVHISGKTDWSTGGHSLNVRLNSWTMYAQFPYSVNKSGGWTDETMCSSEGTISDNTKPDRHSDWRSVNETTKWIKEAAKGTKPFFAYQGMNIVHPAYVTNKYWYDKIDQSKVTVPAWSPLMDVHPCDFESSMLKECTPSDADAAAFYADTRRKRIRSIYYAMIAEFDAMVGAYVDAVREAGALNNTIFIVTSDHGDMQMEHQQFYKMVAYDASSRVPLVVSGPGISPRVVNQPTQLMDIFPTIMDFAGISDRPKVLDGHSLLPLIHTGKDPSRPDYVVSQFHGCNIAMSWFMIRQQNYKLVQYGTGKEVSPQLFDLDKDPAENHDVSQSHTSLVRSMDTAMRHEIDYPSVAQDVATYNVLSLKHWTNHTKDWKEVIHAKVLRWSHSWDANPTGSLQAVEDLLAKPPTVKACRKSLVWPPV